MLPQWFTGSVGFARTPVPRRDAIRSALTLPAVTGVSYAIGGPGVALYASLSALLVVLSERGGTTGQRTLRSGCGLAAGTLAMVLGPFTSGTGLRPLALILAFGLLSGVLSCLGSGPSWAAMQLLVQMAIAGGVQVDLSLGTKTLAYVLGGLVALSAMWLQSALERTDRLYADALADAIRALAGPYRRAADLALGAAAELVLTARPIRPSRRRRLASYRSILGTTSLLAVRPLPPDLGPALREYADQVSAQSVNSVPPALADHLPSPAPELPGAVPVATIVRARLSDRRSWTFTGRLMTCLFVAEVIRQITPAGHAYWIILTVALCLKPDFASVFSRSLQRGFGTALGLVAGWVATNFSAGYAMLPILALLCAFIPWAVRRNYWAFSVIITPLVLLLLDYGGPVGPDVLLQRLVNTATGCAVVLVIGYALVPSTWLPPYERERRRLESEIDQLSRIRSPLDASLSAASIAVELAALRDRARQATGEPGPIRTRAARWEPIADQLDESLAKAEERLRAQR